MVLSTRDVVRLVLAALAVVGSLYLIYLLRRPLTWIFIAGFLAIALAGPVTILQRHMKRGIAMALVYIGLLLAPILIVASLVPPIVEQSNNLADNLPSYVRDFRETIRDNRQLRSLEEKYDVTGKLEQEAAKLPGRLGDAAGTLGDIGLGVVNSLFAAVTILVLSAFLINNGRRWLNAYADRYPPDRAEWFKRLYDRIGDTVRNYVAGALLQATVAGVLSWVVLQLLGIPYALPLAVIVFLLDLVPLVGATLGRDPRRRHHAVQRLPDRHDHLGGLVDRLPAGREHGHPAADPGTGGRRPPVRRAGLRAVREHAVRRARRADRDPGRGRDPDLDPRVPRVPRHRRRTCRRRACSRRRSGPPRADEPPPPDSAADPAAAG